MEFAELQQQQRQVHAAQQELEHRHRALSTLRAAGYSANSHPNYSNCVVVSDPVHRSIGGMLEHTGYEHRTVRCSDVWKFINDRS